MINKQRSVLKKMNIPIPEACDLCSKVKPLVLDHDHESGAFRGWLCMECNVALGKLGDSSSSILKAYQYVAGIEKLK